MSFIQLLLGLAKLDPYDRQLLVGIPSVILRELIDFYDKDQLNQN